MKGVRKGEISILLKTLYFGEKIPSLTRKENDSKLQGDLGNVETTQRLELPSRIVLVLIAVKNPKFSELLTMEISSIPP